MTITRRPLLDDGPGPLADWMAGRGAPRFHAAQVFRWVFGRRAESFEAMTDLPRPLRDVLAEEWEVYSTRVAVEENTGEKFTFVEPLEAYADFVPDLQAADVSPEVRGLAEVCLVLLNSNEFAYVY